jgi:hypothetical protein
MRGILEIAQGNKMPPIERYAEEMIVTEISLASPFSGQTCLQYKH